MHQHDCDEDIVLPNWVSKFGEDDPFPGGFVGSNHFVHSGGYDVPGNYEIVFNNISAFDLLQLTGREGAVTRWSMRILSGTSFSPFFFLTGSVHPASPVD